MGKIKANKFRFHQKAGKDAKNVEAMDLGSEKADSTSPKLPTSQSFSLPDNIFAGVNINLSDISKSLGRQDDTRSISGRSHRELKKDEQALPKKEKMKRRHERFMQKLEVMYENKKNAAKNKKKKRKNNPAPIDVGDEVPLLVNLSDSDEEEVSQRKKNEKKQILSRPCMKAKHRQKADKQDKKHFFKVLNDPVFKTNPAATITQFLKARIAEKRPDLLLE